MKTKKLLLAGSHAATPAYSLVREIKRKKLPWNIYFVGNRWAFEGKGIETLEYLELPRLGVKFFSLVSGKIDMKFTRHTLPAILKIPYGLFHSFFLVLKIKPDLTLSFGGASGALVSFWSWIFGIPVLIHEQVASAGRANILSSFFARKILISRESSKEFFPGSKIIMTGNPLTPEIIEKVKLEPRKEVKTILVTGGSRGSERINKAVKPILPKLRKSYRVILLNGEGQGRLGIKEMAKALSEADIVISRAGANTISEIIALRKPSVLIPIPWSYNDEQTKNAQFASGFGVVRILAQTELTPQRLEKEIQLVKSEIMGRPHGSEILSPDLDASKKVVEILEKYI